jgi:hypothetical protein
MNNQLTNDQMKQLGVYIKQRHSVCVIFHFHFGSANRKCNSKYVLICTVRPRLREGDVSPSLPRLSLK